MNPGRLPISSDYILHHNYHWRKLAFSVRQNVNWNGGEQTTRGTKKLLHFWLGLIILCPLSFWIRLSSGSVPKCVSLLKTHMEDIYYTCVPESAEVLWSEPMLLQASLFVPLVQLYVVKSVCTASIIQVVLCPSHCSLKAEEPSCFWASVKSMSHHVPYWICLCVISSSDETWPSCLWSSVTCSLS